MESLAPPLKCILEIQTSLRSGETVRTGLSRYLAAVSPSDVFATQIREFIVAYEQGRDWRPGLHRISSPYRRTLIELVAAGLAGQTILPLLEDLRGETELACDTEVKHHLETLPLKMLVPLLFFQFPSFMLMIFGPLLTHLIAEMSR